MSSTKHSDRRTIVTDDGELLEPISEPTARLSTIYCNHCGSANKAESNFCHNCGRAIEGAGGLEPIASGKAKHSADRERAVAPAPLSVPQMIYNLVKIGIVGGLVISLVVSSRELGSYIIAGFFIIGWIVVEGIQHGAIRD